MGNITENREEIYDWESEPVYLIEEDDYVEGGEDGVSNRQAKQLTRRTRDLFNRISEVLKKLIKGDSEVLESANTYTNTTAQAIRTEISTATTTTLASAKTYADTAVSAIVDSSPETLNTLNELATALGDDPNFATTVATQIGGKVDKTDPRLTNARPADGGTATCMHWLNSDGSLIPGHYLKYVRINPITATGRLYLQAGDREFDAVQVYFSTLSDRANGADKLWAIDPQYRDVYYQYLEFIAARRRWKIKVNDQNPSDVEVDYALCADELYAPDRGYGSLTIGTSQGLITGQSGFYPTIKTSYGAVYLDCGGEYCGGMGKSNTTGQLRFFDANNKGIRLEHNNGTPATVYCGEILSSGNAVYHSGNFNPETKVNAADVMKVLCAGVVGIKGDREKWKHRVFYTKRINTGYYEVEHNLGHTNYEVQLTAISKIAGPMYASVFMKGDNILLVNTANDTELDDSSFFFQIFEF